MYALNYIDIRVMVRNNQISLDLDPTVFLHPFYSNFEISKLDLFLKERAFDNCFFKICDSSFNPSFKDELRNKTEIKTHVILRPRNYYIDQRTKKDGRSLAAKIYNHINHVRSVTIKPGRSVLLPSILQIVEGTTIPKLDLILDSSLAKLGIVCTKVHHTNTSKTQTFIELYNTGSQNVIIEDLSYIGSFRLIKD